MTTPSRPKREHVVTAADILDRRGYVERIHEAVLGNAGIATHDVLIYHDAALRAQAKTRAEERLLRAALRWNRSSSATPDDECWKDERVLRQHARAVEKERKKGGKG